MDKTDTTAAAPSDACNFTPLFGSDELKLQTTLVAGMALFFAWLGVLGFQKQVAAVMPFGYRSPNAIAPEQTLMAFTSAVVVGARRVTHAGWLRHDTGFHALLGVERFPGADAIRRFFHRFTQPHIEVFWRPLWRWMLELIEAPKAGVSLDLDSTVFSREGTAKGYNPKATGQEESSFHSGGAGGDADREDEEQIACQWVLHEEVFLPRRLMISSSRASNRQKSLSSAPPPYLLSSIFLSPDRAGRTCGSVHRYPFQRAASP